MIKRKHLVLGIACLAAIGAALGLSREPDAIAKPEPGAMSTADMSDTATQNSSGSAFAVSSANPVSASAIDAGARKLAEDSSVDLFATKSWYVAPPPPPAPKPTAPPLPFVMAGSLRDGADIALFVTRGDRNLVLHAGDVVDGNYRLEEIKEGNAVFVYLPLNEKQSMSIGTNP